MNFLLTKQTKTIVISALAIALLGGVSYGGYTYWQSQQVVPEPQEPLIEEPKPTPITEPTEDPNWNLYINKEYGFSVEYPADWAVSESVQNISGSDKHRMASWIKFVKMGSVSIMISVWNTPEAALLEWVKEKSALIVSGGAVVPDKPNAEIAGLPTVVVYSPFGQAPSAVTAVLKSGNRIFKVEHFTPKNENPLLWDIYEHFVKTFEFENTESIPDKLPTFPMGF